MKLLLLVLLVAVCPLNLIGQSSSQKPVAAPHPNHPAAQEIQTETIGVQKEKPPVSVVEAHPPGVMEPGEVKALMHKIWLAQYRLNDLLTQIHPENWKMAPAARQSFGQSLESLRKAREGEEGWRGQFEARPDSMYLGFEVYIALGALLPRIEGVAHSVAQYVNPSFGAQFSQSGNQLFDLQQVLVPHLTFLLKNQDHLLLTAQTGLAACENQLNYAMRGKEKRAVPMRNIAPDFKGGHKRTTSTEAAAAEHGSKGKASAKAHKKAHPQHKTEEH